MRCLFAAVIFLSLATGLRAETYSEWEQLTPDAKPVPFKPWLAPSTQGETINGKSYSTFQAPLGRLFGHLDFSSFPLNDFPLRLRVLYYRIGASDIDPTPNGFIEQRLNWTSPLHYMSANAGPRDLIESRETDIASAAEGAAVPVWSIEGIYTVLIEVASHDGTVLARKQLIEAVADGGTRTACLAKVNSGAESYIGQLQNTEFKSVDILPTEPRVYDHVRVLWLDEATLHDPAYPDDFWRGVFFAGTTVVGHDAEVQALAQRLGISANQRVLRGGLWTAGASADDFANQLSMQGGRYVVHVDGDENPFRKPIVLGRKRIHQLRAFSIGFLVTFTLFEIAIIIGSLYWFQGRRRVLRWLLIPLSAIGYTALGLIVVHFVVDFRPEVEIFREVDSVEGWPNSSVSTAITRLAFDDGRTAFTAPSQADDRWIGTDEANAPLISLPGEKDKTFSGRQKYGRFATSHIRYQLASESPCQVTPDGQIVATRPLSGGWLWDGKVWRNLGPMESGKPIDIAKAGVVIDPKGNPREGGFPMEDQSLYPNENIFPDSVLALCSTGYMDSLKGTNVGLLLAIDPRGVPEQMEDAAGSEIRTQTLLVHQFQLPGAKP